MNASQHSLSSAFQSSWTAQVLASPPMIAPARQFVWPQHVPGEEDALARGAMLLNVKPVTGGNFLATCALGYRDPKLPSGVWTCPQPDDLLAVAGGYAYLVNTRQPEHCQFLPLRPVVEVLQVPDYKMLVLVGFHTVAAIGERGWLWQTAKLSWEGVRLGDVSDGKLRGWGWDMRTDRELPFAIDLGTGEHTGGAFLR